MPGQLLLFSNPACFDNEAEARNLMNESFRLMMGRKQTKQSIFDGYFGQIN